MNCIFFGHRDAPESVKSELEKAIKELINEGISDFYVGNNGNFDFFVQKVLTELSKDYPNLSFTVVLSNLNECAIMAEQCRTLFPEGLEKALPRYAISKRNNWLIANSQVAIVYVKHSFSNAHKLVDKCEKRGIRIINLATN